MLGQIDPILLQTQSLINRQPVKAVNGTEQVERGVPFTHKVRIFQAHYYQRKKCLFVNQYPGAEHMVIVREIQEANNKDCCGESFCVLSKWQHSVKTADNDLIMPTSPSLIMQNKHCTDELHTPRENVKYHGKLAKIKDTYAYLRTRYQ